MYKLEKELVFDFIEKLPLSPFAEDGFINYSTEFNYSRGRTDILLLTCNNKIIAIEAKLHKWRCALHQAYRNTCFADYSYVLVPEHTAKIAQKYSSDFTMRSVGLCYISDGRIIICQSGNLIEPLQIWLNKMAIEFILQGDNKNAISIRSGKSSYQLL